MNIEQEIQNILDRNFTRGDNANALKELLALYNVVWQSEPCGLLHSTDWNGKCFKCGEQVFVREPK